MEHSALTDAACWARALEGDGAAFGEIFDRHRDRVFRHSLHLVPNAEDADDIVATVFLEAWRNRHRVRFVEDSMLPWLLVVATNASRNVARSTRRYRAVLRRLPPPSAEPDLAERFDAGPAEAAYAKLSAAHRQVVALCVLAGLTEAEAAEALGVPRGTVKSRLSRANEILRNRLRETESAELTRGAQS